MSDDKLGYGRTEEDRAAQLEELSAMHNEQTRLLETSTDVEWLRQQALEYRRKHSDAVAVVYEAGQHHAATYAENERLRAALSPFALLAAVFDDDGNTVTALGDVGDDDETLVGLYAGADLHEVDGLLTIGCFRRAIRALAAAADDGTQS